MSETFPSVARATVTGLASATVQIDNARVRVTEWRFAPGQATGQHRHELDYVVVPLTTGRLEARGLDGVSVTDLVAGRPYFRPAGVEHDVGNPNAFDFAFIEIEIKAGG
jgi:quercetin dioxygenase-like cupin family protein